MKSLKVTLQWGSHSSANNFALVATENPIFTGKYTATASKVFTKVCDPDHTPSQETYTATATRTATGTTQTEADALAKQLAEKSVADDIASHGQQYANEHGTCTKKTITKLPGTGAHNN